MEKSSCSLLFVSFVTHVVKFDSLSYGCFVSSWDMVPFKHQLVMPTSSHIKGIPLSNVFQWMLWIVDVIDRFKFWTKKQIYRWKRGLEWDGRVFA